MAELSVGGMRTVSMIMTVPLAVLTLPQTTADWPLILMVSPDLAILTSAPLTVFSVPASASCWASSCFPAMTW